MIIRIFIFVLILATGCSDKNLAEESTENTDEEEARIALNNEDWDSAIELYVALVAEDSTVYSYHPRLATCYAGRSGIDLLNIVKAQFDGSSSAEGGIFDTIGGFLPDDPTDAQLSDIDLAVKTLQAMPSDHRDQSGTYEYSGEAYFQLNLYTVSQSGMFINKFSEPTATGELNQDTLNEMTDAEVEAVLSNLEGLSGGDDEIAAGVNEALNGIDGQEGSTQKEKLINYINATQ